MRFSCSTSKSRTVSPRASSIRKRQRLRAAAPQLGVVDDDAQAVRGDRESAHGVGGVCGGHLGVLLRGVFAGLGSDRAARDRRAAEQQRESGRERRELGGGVHAATSSRTESKCAHSSLIRLGGYLPYDRTTANSTP